MNTYVAYILCFCAGGIVAFLWMGISQARLDMVDEPLEFDDENTNRDSGDEHKPPPPRQQIELNLRPLRMPRDDEYKDRLTEAKKFIASEQINKN